jgi:hypothetical protein
MTSPYHDLHGENYRLAKSLSIIKDQPQGRDVLAHAREPWVEVDELSEPRSESYNFTGIGFFGSLQS